MDLAHSHGMDFICIGTNVTENDQSIPYIERAKKYDMFVCANYMKSYTVSPSGFAEKAKLSKSCGVDLVYLMDYAGGMLPSGVGAYYVSN